MPRLHSEILIEEMGVGKCSNCGFETDFTFLFQQLGPEKIQEKIGASPIVLSVSTLNHLRYR